MKRVTFHTLGCRLNQCETAQMEESLSDCGYEVGPWEEPAAIRVVNTCTVTGKTDRECRRLIRRAKRRDPRSRIVVTGCYAHVAPEEVAAIPGVELVLGNVDKLALPQHLDRLEERSPNGRAEQRSPDGRASLTAVTPYAGGCTGDGPAPRFHDGEFITHFSGYTRAFLKVQNGCDSRCSYCIIPAARGPSRSMPLDDVLRQVKLLGENGFREVVLTGIHIGTWGRDTGEGRLSELLAAILQRTEIGRLRLSSTEPMEITDDVLDVTTEAGDRFARHFHVPLQSGSDRILRRMNRPYRAEGYAERIEAIRRALPEAAIGADVIVGFPGESDDDFGETVSLVRTLPLTYLHVFAYSDRPGTTATAMEGKVHPEKIRERSAVLRSLADEKRHAFESGFRGGSLEALILSQRTEEGRQVGLTGNYLEVAVEGSRRMENEFAVVRPRERRNDGRWSADVVEGSVR